MATTVQETGTAFPEKNQANAAEFEQLMRRTYSYAYSTAYRMMGNASDAEDLTQEAYVRIWTAFDRYNRSRSFEGWLFRILYNLAIDRWRRVSRMPLCSLDADGASGGSATGRRSYSKSQARDGGTPLLNYLADDRPSVMPEQAYLCMEKGKRVRQALSALPGDYRKAVMLADVQGYSYEEIARHVGCPVGTIRSRLHRGRQLLRQTIKTLQEQEEAGYRVEFPIPVGNETRPPKESHGPGLLLSSAL